MGTTAGIDLDRLDRVADVTHWYVDEGKFPGVLTQVQHRDEVVHTDVYGWADIDEGTKLAEDSIFRIYSMTKPIASLALMQLYERGLLLLENRVSRWIPSWAGIRVWEGGTADEYSTVEAEREITVHDLLTHTSGLTTTLNPSHPVHELYRRAGGLGNIRKPDVSLAEACEALARLPLMFQPGTRWHYSMATDVVGHLVELVSGQSFDDYLDEHVFGPLGMTDSGFWVPKEKHERVASLYTRAADKSLRRLGKTNASGYWKPKSFLSGAGGLASTAADYGRFIRMLRNGGELDGQRVIGRKTLEYMRTNQLAGDLNSLGQDSFSEVAMAGTGFGLGFSVCVDPGAARGVESVGTYGWGGAASTSFFVDPVEDLSVMFLTQLFPSNTFPIRRQLQATAYQALT